MSSELSHIDVEFEGEGRLTCVGYLDTLDAEMTSVDADEGVHMYCPSGFKVHVVKDGEVRFGDGSPIPLLPGVYHSTDCGLLTPEGAPDCGFAADEG